MLGGVVEIARLGEAAERDLGDAPGMVDHMGIDLGAAGIARDVAGPIMAEGAGRGRPDRDGREPVRGGADIEQLRRDRGAVIEDLMGPVADNYVYWEVRSAASAKRAFFAASTTAFQESLSRCSSS